MANTQLFIGLVYLICSYNTENAEIIEINIQKKIKKITDFGKKGLPNKIFLSPSDKTLWGRQPSTLTTL